MTASLPASRRPVRILARPVHVAVSKGDEFQAVDLTEDVAVGFGGELGGAVPGGRRVRVRLRGGQDIGVAVQRSAAGREDNPSHSGAYTGVEDVDGAENIDACVQRRLRHRTAHIDLCRLMKDDLGGDRGDDSGKTIVDDVDLMEAGSGVDKLAATSGEVVDHADIRARRDQSVDQS
jgi:hypothetical protein